MRTKEREAKLAAPTGFTLPELGGTDDGFLAEVQPPRRYGTTYWDTPDLRLARWGASLRFREGEGWTLKLPVDERGPLLVREEHVAQGEQRKVPEALADLVRVFVRGAQLGPVGRLRAVRRPVALRNAAGEALAEIVDDEVQVVQGRRVTGRFRELEVELGEAARPDTMQRVLDRLLAAGAEEAEPVSKYLRALDGREVGPPELVPGDLAKSASVEDLLRRDLTDGTLRLFRHEAAARLGEDPEGVHQARVAIRRLRSTLRTFSSVLEPEWTDRLRAELKWLADRLGEVRDADVMSARLERRLDALSEADAATGRRLLSGLVTRRNAARVRLLEAMRERRYVALLDDLVAAAQAPAVTADAARPALEVMTPLVAGEWRKLRKAVKKAGKEPPDEVLHRIRVKAKRSRYAAEAVEPVAGRRARDFAKAVAGVQEVLGDQHDAVVAESWLRQEGAASRRDQALVAGQLVALERAAAADARKRWRPAWKAASNKRLSSWL
jgi:CHAD domain-containing protein